MCVYMYVCDIHTYAQNTHTLFWFSENEPDMPTSHSIPGPISSSLFTDTSWPKVTTI